MNGFAQNLQMSKESETVHLVTNLVKYNRNIPYTISKNNSTSSIYYLSGKNQILTNYNIVLFCLFSVLTVLKTLPVLKLCTVQQKFQSLIAQKQDNTHL